MLDKNVEIFTSLTVLLCTSSQINQIINYFYCVSMAKEKDL